MRLSFNLRWCGVLVNGKSGQSLGMIHHRSWLHQGPGVVWIDRIRCRGSGNGGLERHRYRMDGRGVHSWFGDIYLSVCQMV